MHLEGDMSHSRGVTGARRVDSRMRFQSCESCVSAILEVIGCSTLSEGLVLELLILGCCGTIGCC